MKTLSNPSRKHEAGYTLVEVMVAAVLTAIFFASLFELNAMCLRYIDSSKESLAALQCVQDRIEALRNRNFNDLVRTDCSPCVPVPPATTCVTTPCVHDLLVTPSNQSPFTNRATEVVTISNYPPTANGVTQYTRGPGGIVTTQSEKTKDSDLVQVDVAVTWTTTTGARTRTESTSCIVSNGNKK